MRKVLFSLAAAASALAVATPASAQWAPQPYPAPAYGYPGYSQFGQVRLLQARINGIQRQIRFLDQRNIISNREARRLREQSRSIEHRLVRASRYGLSQWEARDIESRIARLEYRVQREAMDRNGRWGRYAGYGEHDLDRTHDNWRDRNDDDHDRDHD